MKFLNDNRPRRRYLYFRFIVSYLWARRDNPQIESHIGGRKFWPSNGEYLNRSTLQTLARCISGCEIPPYLIQNQTFEDLDDPRMNEVSGMTTGNGINEEERILRERAQPRNQTSSNLIDAVTDSLKQL